MQCVQSDPRFMHVFKELTGVDLMDMQEQQMRKTDKEADVQKNRDAEMKVKKEEEERKKKEDEMSALPEEERIAFENKKAADEFKAEGNVFYKAKNFEKALELYQNAIDKVPSELTYYSNKAAVLMEQKNF